ncbi:MAG: PfkB family carbohydrate kinase [Bdellovibrionota bacterium]
MSPKSIDIVGVSGLVENLYVPSDPETLRKLNFRPGSWGQLTHAEYAALIADFPNSTFRETSGAGVNTIIKAQQEGAKTFLITCFGGDEAGVRSYTALDLYQVEYSQEAKDRRKGQTNQSAVFISKNEDQVLERTMRTALGGLEGITPENILEERIADSNWVYWEAYELTNKFGKAVIDRIVELAIKHTVNLAIDLCSEDLITNKRSELTQILKTGVVKLLIADLAQIKALTGTPNSDQAFDIINNLASRFGFNYLVTDGPRAITYTDSEPKDKYRRRKQVEVSPVSSDLIKDPTGAGDIFAGTALASIVLGSSYQEAVERGAIEAAKVIQILGVRGKPVVSQ